MDEETIRWERIAKAFRDGARRLERERRKREREAIKKSAAAPLDLARAKEAAE